MEIMLVIVQLCLIRPEGDVCQEEIALRQPSTTHTCIVSMADLVDWKLHSPFKADEWIMKRFDCRSGDYKTKKSI